MAATKEKESYIYTLAKVFSNPDWAEQFRRGKLHMNCLEYFRQCESIHGDHMEGSAKIWQPRRIGQLLIANHPINLAHIVGPIHAAYERDQHAKAFCMFAGHSHGRPSISADTLREVWDKCLLTERMKGFGHYVVVVLNARKFIEKVERAALNKGYRLQRGLIEYFELDEFHGDTLHPGFHKPRRFEDEREYRFRIDVPPPTDNKPITLDIGDQRDNTFLCTIEEHNRELCVRLPDGSVCHSKSL